MNYLVRFVIGDRTLPLSVRILRLNDIPFLLNLLFSYKLFPLVTEALWVIEPMWLGVEYSIETPLYPIDNFSNGVKLRDESRLLVPEGKESMLSGIELPTFLDLAIVSNLLFYCRKNNFN